MTTDLTSDCSDARVRNVWGNLTGCTRSGDSSRQAWSREAAKAAETGPHERNDESPSAFYSGNIRNDCSDDEVLEQAKYNDGCAGSLVKNKKFEYTTLAVILLNAGAIGWDSDYSARNGSFSLWEPETPIQFLIVENGFAAFFSIEIIIRFCAYKHKLRALWDLAFIFDSVLVGFMVFETWGLPLFLNGSGSPLGQLSILRLLRLLRITRMAKLMRAFPELMMIVKGITAATRAVAWTAILLVIITYTWAILFTNEYHQGLLEDDDVVEGSGAQFFGSMGKSMLSLLVMGTILDDVTVCTTAIRNSENIWMLAAFIIYILINSFTMMNMLVGILVEVVGNTADEEKKRLQEEKVRGSIKSIFRELDTDRSGRISRKEFEEMKDHEKVKQALSDLQIKRKQFDAYCKLLIAKTEGEEETTIGFEEFVNMILRLRPDTAVTSLDFAAFRQVVHAATEQIKNRMGRLERCFNGWTTESGSTALPHLRGARNDEARGEADSAKKLINVNMLAMLERTPSAVIINELQRRLGMPSLEETGIPLSMMDEELQHRVREAEAFQALYVPEQDPAWSKETMMC
eukprot:TRINITY_DN44764_c0_g1_i1.p1 TRINITY_DN44764_c0_g1~~TRINITY_DN44764_c0_g1_i1.p1  ORF type:complete len:574 (-),score=117.55 TRINITY_DN44764_c0_g1_i1:42-1763(-)